MHTKKIYEQLGFTTDYKMNHIYMSTFVTLALIYGVYRLFFSIKINLITTIFTLSSIILIGIFIFKQKIYINTSNVILSIVLLNPILYNQIKVLRLER